ncbi:MAG TPA: SBBP repeat-containing protein, partial [Bacteroidota bacterium]
CDDAVAAMAVDGSGNFFIVGTAKSTVFLGSEDIVTIKYDATGNWQWTRLYNGTGNYTDAGLAVTADASGNSYVVGKSAATGSGNFDYITIKYNSTGDTVWTRRFDMAGGTDYASAVAVDGSGNVFVTGTVTDGGGYYDAMTIKYNSSGDSLWASVLTAGNSANEQGCGIGLDNSGNVFVSGTAALTGSTAAFLAKYNTSGTMQWDTTYASTANYTNTVIGMITSTTGTNVVFGTTSAQGSSSRDYLVLKYDSSENFLWSANYASSDNSGDGATAIAVDDSGYIYATGSVFTALGGLDDIYTVKLSPAGDTLWSKKYDGGSTDIGRAIAVDAQGNVYVAGETYQSAWKVVTIKYNRTGVQQWAQVYTAGGGGDTPNAIALDASSNVIVTGTTYSGSNDFLTLKYNASGSMIGTPRKYNPGGSNGDDQAHAVITDGSGNFYVVGHCQLTSNISNTDIAVVKYGGLAGTQQWAFTYSGPGAWQDDGISICRDSAGYLYIAGSVFMSAGSVIGLTQSNFDIAVLKMTTAGDTIWTRIYSGPSDCNDYPAAIAYDGHGGIYVAGGSYNVTSPYDADMLIVRMDTAGSILWSQTYNRSVTHDNEFASGLAVDTAGNAYLAGSAGYAWGSLSVTSVDMTVLRYDRETGNLAWSAFYNGTANGSDAAKGIGVDKSGNVYVAGNAAETLTSDDFTVVRFSQSIALPVEATNVTATVATHGVTLHWLTFTETNNAGWEVDRKKLASSNEQSADGSWLNIGYVTGAGTSTSPKNYEFKDVGIPGGRYAYRMKQIDRTGSYKYLEEVDVEVGLAPKEFTLAQNYPNPFNPSTTLQFTLEQSGRAVMKIYNVLGQEVATVFDQEAEAGQYYQVQFNAARFTSGVYVSVLESGGKRMYRKMLLVK